MQRIISFNPGDNVTYPAQLGVINVGAADAGSKLLLYNETPYNLDLDFLNGNQSILHAWEARYWTLDGDTKQINWVIDSSLSVTSPPISLVMGELYGPTEKIEGTYPVALIRQIGDIAVSNNPASSLVNVSSASGTSVISIGDTNGTVFSLSNDGLLTISLDIAGVLTQIFKTSKIGSPLTIGALNQTVNAAGNFAVSGLMQALAELQVQNDISFQGGNSSTVFGNTAGSANVWQPFKGLPFNVVLVYFVGFQNNGVAAQNIALPQPFQNSAKVWSGGQPACSFTSSGTAQSISVITALASTGGSTTGVTTLPGNSIGECNHAFDTISLLPAQTSAHTGLLLLIGS